MKVKDCMSRNVVSVGAQEPVSVAARLMSRYNLGILPVQTPDGRTKPRGPRSISSPVSPDFCRCRLRTPHFPAQLRLPQRPGHTASCALQLSASWIHSVLCRPEKRPPDGHTFHAMG